MTAPRVVLAVTGASGAPLALGAARRLAQADVETHLVVSGTAERTLHHECGPDALNLLSSLAHQIHDVDDVGATIASGSFRTHAMLVVPCSMRTLAAIATGLADNLIVRAADVHLKQRRRLVLVARETPLHLGHLRNMIQVTEIGAIVMPPAPAFYALPQTIEDVVDDLAARAIDLLDLGLPPQTRPWSSDHPAAR